MSKLIITSGEDAGKEVVLGDTQIIGRLPSTAIPIKDAGSSRQNTRVYRSQGGYVVIDLNSKNGTFVNEERVERADLNDGDVIRIGTTALRFVFEEEAPAAAVRGGAAPAAAALTGNPDQVIAFGGGGGRGAKTVSEKALQFGAPPKAKRKAKSGTLGFLRQDISQHSALFRYLVIVGVVLIMVGVGAWIFRLVAGKPVAG